MENLTTFSPIGSTNFTTNLFSTTLESNFTNFNASQTCEPMKSTVVNIIAGVLGTLVALGNGLVILAILGGRSKLFRPMYWFIVHISLSDFLLGIMLLWNYSLMALFDIQNTMGSLTVIHSFWLVSACASVLGIFMLALDRYMQVVHRDIHRVYFNQITVLTAILFCWVVPVCLCMVPPLIMDHTCKESCRCIPGEYMECRPIEDCSLVVPPFRKSTIRQVAVFLYTVMPCPIIIYCALFYKVRKQTRLFHQKMKPRDIRLIKTLVIIMAIFIVTLLPSGVVLILDSLSGSFDEQLIKIGISAFMLATLNSLANPILYIWRIAAIRTSLRKQLFFLQSPTNSRYRTSNFRQTAQETAKRKKTKKFRNLCLEKPNQGSSDYTLSEVTKPTLTAGRTNTTESPSFHVKIGKKGVRNPLVALFTRASFQAGSSSNSTPNIPIRNVKNQDRNSRAEKGNLSSLEDLIDSGKNNNSPTHNAHNNNLHTKNKHKYTRIENIKNNCEETSFKTVK